MARMIPATPRDFHGSLGEERVFRALRTLPDEIIVIHSFRWLHPGDARASTRDLVAQGEGDFVLFDPTRGLMVVEVKGGDVWCECGEWRQRNRRTGHVETIFPETQANNTMHRIRLDLLEKVPDGRNLLFCHAVWFPDGAVDRAKLPMNYHPDTTLDAEDVARPATAIQRAFGYWHSILPGRRGVGATTAKLVFDALMPSLSIVRSVRQTLDEREEQLVQLTREQARVIDFLDEQPHAAILGAAGTGKTLLERTGERSGTLVHATELGTREVAVRAQLQAAEARLRQTLLADDADLESATRLLGPPILAALLARQIEIYRQVRDVSRNAAERHPQMVSLRAEQNEIQERKRLEIQQIAQRQRHEIQVLRHEQASLRESIRGRERGFQERGEHVVELERLEREAHWSGRSSPMHGSSPAPCCPTSPAIRSAA